MDMVALSEDKFNPVQWINENFLKYVEENKFLSKEEHKKSLNEHERAIDFINNYVSKLQLYVQQVNYALEESSHRLVSTMPRIVKDVRSLQAGVERLQQRMLLMHQGVAAVQKETGECMTTLDHLNSMQMKVQNAKESLQESDGWGNLIASLEDGFERNDVKGICDKIVSLQKSLLAQEQLPGHSDRQSQVEDFKNRLEALASPKVVQCFAEGNVKQAQYFVTIFDTIHRKSQLLQYYRAVQKTALQQQWKQTLELQATESITQQQQFLALFYDHLMENLQGQVKWCFQVFEDQEAQEQPFLLLVELLPALQPTRYNHILQLLRTCNERLELLQRYAQDNHVFVMQLNAYLKQACIQLNKELKHNLGQAIYEYFYKFIEQYPRVEETQLSRQIDRTLITQTHISDAVRHLKDATNKTFDWLTEALARSLNITGDLALCKLINLFASIFKRILDQFAKIQRQLTLHAGVNSECSWSLLQYTLDLLECLADFQQRLQNFEKVLHERLNVLEQNLRHSQHTSINFYETFESVEQQRLLASIKEFQQKRLEPSQNNQVIFLGIFNNIYDSFKLYFKEIHDVTLNILLQPLESHLSCIQPPTDLNQSRIEDMPAFSFAPQESVTQIGQYLLTLPQHLEPLLLAPSPVLKQALEMCNINYSQPTPSADILLSLVVTQCCVLYQTQILQIKNLNTAMARQLAVDIEYLRSVVEELGLALSITLNQIHTLLKAEPENYLALSAGCEPRLVTAIRQMRNIISKQ
uniref:Conserved oligomeric Golgi complex subunit 7 n=1 Tax=Glossina morsitans morsitans TaxID=37546 RepID=A0A1B0FJU9_GLOMM